MIAEFSQSNGRVLGVESLGYGLDLLDVAPCYVVVPGNECVVDQEVTGNQICYGPCNKDKKQ